MSSLRNWTSKIGLAWDQVVNEQGVARPALLWEALIVDERHEGARAA